MRSSLRLAGLLLAALCVGRSASAQSTRPERPYRGIFASGVDTAADSLSVTGNTGVGWDSSTAADTTGADADSSATAGSSLKGAGYNMFGGSIVYTRSRERVQFGASAATSGRYYSSLSAPWVMGHSGRVNLGYRKGRSTMFNVAQSVSYQPFGSLGLFPGLGDPTAVGPNVLQSAASPDLDTRALRTSYTSSATDAGVEQRLSRRSTVSLQYSYRLTRYTEGRGQFHAQDVRGRFNRTLTEHLGLRLGYGYGESRFVGASDGYQNHYLDLGVSYNRALSISRRTVLGFDTSSAGTNDGTRTRWDILGGAVLTHEIGRTWALSGAFRRDVQFIETLRQPIFTDAVNSNLSGLLSRRVQVNAGAGASSGSLGIQSRDKGVWSYYGTAGMGIAVSRYLQLSARYGYYQYRFDDPVYRALGFTQQMRRHTIGVFVSGWAPLLQKGRRTNASR